MALIGEQVESEIRLWLETFFATLASGVIGGTAGMNVRRLFTTGKAVGQAEDIGAAVATFNQAYVAGKVAGVLGTNTVRKMSFQQLLNAVENSPITTMNPADQEVLTLLERNSARLIARRAAVAESKVQEILAIANTRWTGAVQSGMGTAEAAAARHSLLSELSQQVGFQLATAGTDSKRLMQTELANYFQRGQVQDKNPELEVWKIPRDTAEAQCLRIYLNPDGSPRRYLLKDVLGNSNIGLPPEQWKFVIGATHPFCYCILFEEEATRRRPGPNKKLADRREDLVTGGTVIPTGPASQAARRGRSVLPKGTRYGVRVGDRVVPLGSKLDPAAARRIQARVAGKPGVATDIPQRFEKLSQKIETRLMAKPKVTQNTADIDELFRAAAVADPQLQTLVRGLADDLGGEALFPPGLKKKATAITKAQTKYSGNYAALTDLSRASLQFDKLDDVYGALAAIEKKAGVKIVRMNDRFLRPTAEGYRDIISNLRMPNGHVVELQLHVKQIVKVKDKAHILYERQRRIRQTAELAKRDLTIAEYKRYQGLMAKQQKLYGKAFVDATTDIAPRVPAALRPARAPARAPVRARAARAPPARQVTVDIDDLYRAAAEAQPKLTMLTRDLADNLRGAEAVIPTRLMSRRAATVKAKTLYGGDLAKVTDLTRATLMVDKAEDGYAALSTIEKWKRAKILRVNDRFARPLANGYKDLVATTRLPGGHIAQLQILPKWTADVRNRVNILVKRQRAVLAKATAAGRDLTVTELKRIKSLMAQQQKAMAKPVIPKPAKPPAMPVSKDIPDEFAEISQKVEKRLAAKPKVKQNTDDLDDLYRAAAEADPILQKTVKQLADDLGGEAMFPPGLKGRERAVEKVMAKYGGDFAALTDLSRATLAFDKMEDVYGALAQLEKRGLKIVRLNDRFLRPTTEGYRDIITNVRMPNGHVAELQLHVKGITKAKDASHKLYEQQRSILAKAKTAGRDLTKAEMATVRSLVEQQQVSYGAAFAEATAVKPKLGIQRVAAPSKLKPGTVKPAEPDDILKAKGRNPAVASKVEKQAAAEEARAWNEMADGKISMTEFFEQSMKGTGAKLESFQIRGMSSADVAKLKRPPSEDPLIFFGYKAKIKIGDTAIPAKLTRNFVKRPGGWEIDHELLEIGWAGQGTGLAKKILRNDMELYQKMGIKAINLEAGLEVGGYAWARYGFVPTAEAWKTVKDQVLARAKLVMKDLSPSTRTILKQALGSQDPKAIWKIADIREPVGKFDPKLLDPKGHYPPVKPGNEPLGSFLLREQNWKGSLNLADETAVSRTMNYVGV